LVLGRPRGLVTGLVAAAPTSVIAVVSAYRHELLTSQTPTTAAATQQGHRVAAVVIACVAGAALLRVALSPLDERLASYHLPERSRRPVLIGAWAAAVVAVIAIGLAAHAPSRISDQYNRFVETAEASPDQKVRPNIFDPSNRGLIDNWKVALDGFKDRPLTGQGAGTYEVYWNQHRPAKQASYNVVDGHSLYVEILGEQGIVGLLLLLTFIVTMLVALAPFRRGPNRALYAALFATALAWAAHAGVDWDWEMPAVTAPVIALGGAALATHDRDLMPSWTTAGARVTIGLLLLLAAVTPGLVLASQRQLNDARDALRAGDCRKAVDRASASISTLAVRPEAYEVLGLCQATDGRPGFAVQALRRASKRDPNNWRYHYELGVVQGAAGLDPRAELATAHRLDPTNPELNDLLATIPKGQTVNWDLQLTAPGGASAGIGR
jgi:hypothetical protein